MLDRVAASSPNTVSRYDMVRIFRKNNNEIFYNDKELISLRILADIV